jgi:hypothetical protein
MSADVEAPFRNGGSPSPTLDGEHFALVVMEAGIINVLPTSGIVARLGALQQAGVTSSR